MTPILIALMTTSIQVQAQEHKPFWFQRACSHYGEIDDAFGDYIDDVRPQIVIAGFFGPNYWSAMSYAREKGVKRLWTSLGGGPVDRDWMKQLIERSHRNGAKFIGLFSLSRPFGDPEKPAGFFKFIDEDWDDNVLGPKPETRAIDMMEKKADGSLWKQEAYRVEGGAEYWGCISNPHWREVLKRMVTAAIGIGLDGFHIIFPQREGCVCEYCQAAFRRWLGARHTAAQLKERHQINDLKSHTFSTISGWYEREDASEYALECLKFTQASLKDCYDEVFIRHGRAIKPDLILGQWNHIYRSSYKGPGQLAGTFAQLNADERCVLPSTRWGKGEDFVWYSIGNWRMYDKPDEHSFADFGIERKYLYEAGGGKPSTVKMDDNVRIQLTFAESVAYGGFAYPRGPDYRDASTHNAVKAWFDFLRKNEQLYHPATPYSEAALVWNRRAVHRGDTLHTADFKRLGSLLTKNHVLYDVLIDDNLSLERLKQYRLVLLPSVADFIEDEQTTFSDFIGTDGKVVVCNPARGKQSIEGAVVFASKELQAISPVAWQEFEPYLDVWLPNRSGISARDTISFTCFETGRGTGSETRKFVVHLINYHRDRRPADGVSGADIERPIPAGPIPVRVVLPAATRARKVSLHSVENSKSTELKFDQENRSVSFVVPKIVVYAAIKIEAR